MEESTMFNVADTFDTEMFAEKLADTYRAKGYNVNVVKMNGIYSLTLDKGIGGINMLFGMGLGIKANITRNNDTVSISYSDAEWTSKIIGLVVGWFFCLIPFITAIIGSVQQLSLPKSISKDAQMIAASM